MKLVINACNGGFGLSVEAVLLYSDLKNLNIHAYNRVDDKENGVRFYKQISCSNYLEGPFIYYTKGPIDLSLSYKEITKELSEKSFEPDYIPRHDEMLVKAVEELGSKANGLYAELKVIEIPDEVSYMLESDHGNEWIAEVHRRWG